MRDAVQGTNTGLGAIVAHIEALRKLQAERTLTPREFRQLLAATAQLAMVENNRTMAVVQVVTGRRNTDNMPPAQLERVVYVLAGMPSQEPAPEDDGGEIAKTSKK